MLKKNHQLPFYFTCIFLMLLGCKKRIEVDCPNYLKITNSTNLIVDLKFYLNAEVIETINIQPRTFFKNDASDKNEYGMPEYFFYSDSMEMVFDGSKSLVYKKNESLTSKNILVVNNYTQSKSKSRCENNDEVVYDINSEHLSVAK